MVKWIAACELTTQLSIAVVETLWPNARVILRPGKRRVTFSQNHSSSVWSEAAICKRREAVRSVCTDKNKRPLMLASVNVWVSTLCIQVSFGWSFNEFNWSITSTHNVQSLVDKNCCTLPFTSSPVSLPFWHRSIVCILWLTLCPSFNSCQWIEVCALEASFANKYLRV